MAEPAKTLDGWYVLHDLRSVDWASWKKLSPTERENILSEFHSHLEKWDAVEASQEGSHGMYKMMGQKSDIMFMWLRPTMDELHEIEHAFNKSGLAEFLIPNYSYVSVVELSNYLPADKDPNEDPEIQARLKPILPKWQYVLFLSDGQAPRGQ